MPVTKPTLYLVLRGHLRSALTTPELRNFVLRLMKHYDVVLHVFTWNTVEASASYRRLDVVPLCPYPDAIERYFPCAAFVHVDDEWGFHAVYSNDADSDKKVGLSKMPVNAYRQYMYTLWKSTATLPDTQVPCVNMRIDFFSGCAICKQCVDAERIVHAIVRASKTDLSATTVMMTNKVACDNVMIGTCHNFKEWFAVMFRNYDTLIQNSFINQEMILLEEIKRRSTLTFITTRCMIDGKKKNRSHPYELVQNVMRKLKFA